MKSITFILVLFVALSTFTTNCRLTSVFYGSQGFTMDEVQRFEQWSNKSQVAVVLFTDWCQDSLSTLFNVQLANIWGNGSIPLLTWEMKPCGAGPGVTVKISRGEYDWYINQFGDMLKKYLAGPDGVYGNWDDRRVYLRMGHEMNGNWYPWSAAMGGSTPNDYVDSWRRTYDIIVKGKGLNATRLQWIWCVNNADVGGFSAEEYWPGEDYVDWLGIDGYNWGLSASWSAWLWPNQIFDDMVYRVRKLAPNKPLSFNEYGSTTKSPWYDPDTLTKQKWLQNMCQYILDNDVRMASYFNIDKETDWAVFDGIHGTDSWNGRSVYNSVKDCLNGATWIVSDKKGNPRLINDKQFITGNDE